MPAPTTSLPTTTPTYRRSIKASSTTSSRSKRFKILDRSAPKQKKANESSKRGDKHQGSADEFSPQASLANVPALTTDKFAQKFVGWCKHATALCRFARTALICDGLQAARRAGEQGITWRFWFKMLQDRSSDNALYSSVSGVCFFIQRAGFDQAVGHGVTRHAAENSEALARSMLAMTTRIISSIV